MTEEQIDRIKQILEAGDRVEIMPVKDGIRVFRIQRREIKKPAPKC